MSIIIYVIIAIISLVLGFLSISMYSILQDQTLTTQEQHSKISPYGNWTLGLGISIIVLVCGYTALTLVKHDFAETFKTFGVLLGLLFGVGIFLIIIGWQLKAIETSSMSEEKKHDKYVGFAITITGISGLVVGLSIGYFVNSLRKTCIPVPCQAVDCKPVSCKPISTPSPVVVTGPSKNEAVVITSPEPVIRTDV
jgi:hypothetical protein